MINADIPMKTQRVHPGRASSNQRLLSWSVTAFTAAVAMACASLIPVPSASAADVPNVPVTSTGAPQTIPALSNWTSTTGTLTVDNSLRVGADAVSRQAKDILIDDLSQQLGRNVGTTDDPGKGDVSLRRDESRLSTLGPEGYELVVNNGIHVVGATDDGVFWGARTVLQLLTQGKTIPQGSSVDSPKYQERGVGICACQITSDVDWIVRLIKDMSYVKLNQLWLETKVKSDAYPKANFWGYFTPAQARQITAAAKAYHVNVVPEVNSPGHMAPWLRNYPELQLKDVNGERDANRLDITQPEAFKMVTTLFDEYSSSFDTKYWHMGGDEYMLGSAYANYPQFQQYINAHPETFAPDATPTDVVIDFMNRVDAYVKSKGKTLRVWNDGQIKGSTLTLNRDIVVEHWLGGDNLLSPQELVDAGHAVENSAYSLYLIRSSGNDPFNPEKLWNEHWTPQSFEDGSKVVDNLSSGGHVTGAKVSAWPDNAAEQTENEVENSLFAGTRFISQATWGSPDPVASYSDFTALSKRVGRVPGFVNVNRTPVKDGSYKISSGGRSFVPAVDGPLSLGTASTRVRFTATVDGYYTITSPNGQCLTIDGGTLTLGAPLDQGLPPQFEACSSGDNLQKWQVRSAAGGFTIANAITLEPLTLVGQKLVQQAPDVQSPTVFALSDESAPTSPSASASPADTPSSAPTKASTAPAVSPSDAADDPMKVGATTRTGQPQSGRLAFTGPTAPLPVLLTIMGSLIGLGLGLRAILATRRRRSRP